MSNPRVQEYADHIRDPILIVQQLAATVDYSLY
jgi:hypothetical protein